MKNIIITGGELFNKGAQAMVFVTVDEMKKRFPNHNIYVLSERDCKRPEKERNQYAFYFTGWYPVKFAKAQSNPLIRWLCLFKNRKELFKCEQIYRNTDIMVDISGYALGGVWSDNCNQLYLDNLFFAKKFHIPVYLMPQSFGPFRFAEEGRKKIDFQLRELLPQCKVICAREKESYDELTNNLRLKNVVLKPDLVLNNRSVNYNNIYRIVPKLNLPEIQTKSVAIIPNANNNYIKNKNKIMELYKKIISELLCNEYDIYLIYHAPEDQEMCKEIKNNFLLDESVHFLDQEFSCIEFGELAKRFNFLIASRYHSVVHAYKNAVPCIVLGWATKYKDLTTMFNQEKYMFDMREDVDEGHLISSVQRLCELYQNESLKISEVLNDIQQKNVFDIIQ